jgi:hypothetical protein
MPVSIFADSHVKHYLTYSRISPAYFVYVGYIVSLIAVPLIIVVTAPIQGSAKVELFQPNLSFTGNYYLTTGSTEASSLVPVNGVDVTISAGDADFDGTNDQATVQISSTRFSSIKSILLAIEAIDSYNSVSILLINLMSGEAGNRISSWAEVIKQALFVPSREPLHTALQRPGNRNISKLTALESQYRILISQAGTISESVSGSNTFSGTLILTIPEQIRFNQQTRGEIFRVNFIYFITLFIFNKLILSKVYSALIRSRIIPTLRYII